MAGAQTDYPVDVQFQPGIRINRLWGIPFIGLWIRGLVLIPYIIVFYVVAVVAVIASIFTWIPVLLFGRYPGWGYTWVGGYLRWTARTFAYISLLTSHYPAFSLRSQPTEDIWVKIDEGGSINRLWGIPIVGIVVRYVLVIPHLIVLAFLSLVVWIVFLVSWIPVLLTGHQASLVYTIVGGYLRWLMRVLAYVLLLSSRYPPFSLS